MKHIIIILWIFAFLLVGCQLALSSNTKTKDIQVSQTLEELIRAEFIELKFEQPEDSYAAKQQIIKIDNYLNNLNNILEIGKDTKNYYRALEIINPEINKALALKKQYEDIYYNLSKAEETMRKWELCFQEYQTASIIWMFMRNVLDWNEAVCAGVMGNIMAEAGGNTLDIRPEIYDPDGLYYGICQWNIWAFGDVFGKDLETQLNLLAETVEYEFDVYGLAYYNGFKYDDFIKITSPSEAAIAFAKCYERCASYTYTYREQNALAAYEYFTN